VKLKNSIFNLPNYKISKLLNLLKSALKQQTLFARSMGKEVQEWLINSRIPNLMSPVSGPRVGTWRSRYMIPIRLPWRLRARPSATLHEIQGQLRRANWCIHDKDSRAVRQDVVSLSAGREGHEFHSCRKPPLQVVGTAESRALPRRSKHRVAKPTSCSSKNRRA
jgi:hypothetical protein